VIRQSQETQAAAQDALLDLTDQYAIKIHALEQRTGGGGFDFWAGLVAVVGLLGAVSTWRSAGARTPAKPPTPAAGRGLAHPRLRAGGSRLQRPARTRCTAPLVHMDQMLALDRLSRESPQQRSSQRQVSSGGGRTESSGCPRKRLASRAASMRASNSRRTTSRPASPMRRRNPGSSAISPIRRASASTSPGGTRKPETPSSTSSLTPAIRVASPAFPRPSPPSVPPAPPRRSSATPARPPPTGARPPRPASGSRRTRPRRAERFREPFQVRPILVVADHGQRQVLPALPRAKQRLEVARTHRDVLRRRRCRRFRTRHGG
jgi:hypothetical protein